MWRGKAGGKARGEGPEVAVFRSVVVVGDADCVEWERIFRIDHRSQPGGIGDSDSAAGMSRQLQYRRLMRRINREGGAAETESKRRRRCSSDTSEFRRWRCRAH